MTRILMEEAKRYTDTKRISDLIPDVRDRRQTAAPGSTFPGMRSQSFTMPPQVSRKKSYPIISGVAAQSLPSRAIADRLLEVFYQRGDLFSLINPFLTNKRILGLIILHSSSIHSDLPREGIRNDIRRRLCREHRCISTLRRAPSYGN